MKKKRGTLFTIHAVLLIMAFLTFLPFGFLVNNVFRTKAEFDRSFFSVPDCLKGLAKSLLAGKGSVIPVTDRLGERKNMTRGEAVRHYIDEACFGPKVAWDVLRKYTLNTFIVVAATAFGVCLLASAAAFILARYRFRGKNFIYLMILSTMMFPGVMYLIPRFLLIKELGMINTYCGLILPFISGGLVFATFLFKSFFEGLPEDLFESARIDGAGYIRMYWSLILPLSKPVFSVVLITTIMGTWNDFLWPFIVLSDNSHQVIASGLFVMYDTNATFNPSTMYAAYAISSIPLLILFIYATKPFVEGMTSGALKA